MTRDDIGASPIPDLVTGTPFLSSFEFCPTGLFYAPLKLYGLILALRYGGLTIPTIADPLFDTGGVHDESKYQIYSQIPDSIRSHFAHTLYLFNDGQKSLDARTSQSILMIEGAGWAFPIIIKPNIGLRGMGVQKAHNRDDVRAYLKQFPEDEAVIFQPLYDYAGEVGLFYIRKPDEEKGHIFSLTAKFFSHVMGDGISTLKELIQNHPRYGKIAHVYLPRHKKNWERVLENGQGYKIAFAGSHSRGTIFKDATHLVTPKMTEAWDTLSKQIPEFYFGRFDVRFENWKDLETLQNLKIVEVNGASAEATHVWDSSMSLWKAYKTLMEQYKLVYQIGAMNKKRGFEPMPLKELLKRVKHADELVLKYPHTH